MTSQKSASALGTLLLALLVAFAPVSGKAEYEEEELTPRNAPATKPAEKLAEEPPPAEPAKKKSRVNEKRRYITDHPDRVDAGIFHAAFAFGGNFYTEPIVTNAGAPTGNYSKDFGFGAGAYFDYDYSELNENIPLGLRGFVGYKYILSSVHVFTFDGMVRRMFNLSEKVTFGLGFGGSAAIWYRTVAAGISNQETIIFLPCVAIGAGFEFNPFMVDFKWLINQFGADATRTGFEFYFGFRL